MDGIVEPKNCDVDQRSFQHISGVCRVIDMVSKLFENEENDYDDD